MAGELTPRTRSVTVSGRAVEVRELSLRKIGQLADIIGGLAAPGGPVDRLKSAETADVIGAVIEIVRTAPAQVAAAFALATDAPSDLILDATPRELMALGQEVWDLNNLADILGKAKAPAAGPAA
jgi:hypothetical protein